MFKKKDFFLKLFNQYKTTKKIPQVDLHTHTSWTDGKNTVFEMSSEAVKKKLETVLFSEHTRANTGEWFPDFVKEIKESNVKFKNKCLFLIGTEVKILNDKGELDLSTNIKEMCDLVMASVHRFPEEKGEIMHTQGNFSTDQAIMMEYELASAAIENPDVDIIGHPFGMTLKRFKATPPWDLFAKLIKKAKKFDKVIEVNFHYHNNYKQIIDECLKNGTLISFGSNAHSTNELGQISQFKI